MYTLLIQIFYYNKASLSNVNMGLFLKCQAFQTSQWGTLVNWEHEVGHVFWEVLKYL